MKSPERNPEYRVEFEPLGKVATCHIGDSFMDAARRAGLEITSLCGGKGTCGRCRVQMFSGQVSSPHADEAQALGPRSLAEGYRLASVFRADASGDAEALLQMAIEQHHMDCRVFSHAVRMMARNTESARASGLAGSVSLYPPRTTAVL